MSRSNRRTRPDLVDQLAVIREDEDLGERMKNAVPVRLLDRGNSGARQ